jgi:N-acetylglucosaminyldiphosphoundecaprenol N-acetyl-beta-D-mannosaminyltransferase
MANILGINLSDLELSKLLERLDFFLKDEKSHFLVTPNPEIILQASHNEEYFYILNSADVAIADGFGLVLAGLLQGKKIPRITGSDLTPLLLNKAEQENIKTLIINWSQGLSSAQDIKDTLKVKWPKLIFEVLDTDKKDTLSEIETSKINNFAPRLIFVTLGAPYQEKLIGHELKNWKSVKLALAVGGSFDFITNKIKRAPKLIRSLGMEWFWRLIKQPKRFKRIWRATFIFVIKMVIRTFVQPLIYRKNVAIMLYKKNENKLEILLVAREDNHNHWQLPQGGTDGEELETAGARELQEELGTDKFTAIKTFKNLYCYDFPEDMSKQKHIGYKGQKQGLFIAEFTGSNDDIKLNYWDHVGYKWVDANELINSVHEYRKNAVKKFLPKFLEVVK